MTEDMHEERLQAVEAFGDSFVSLKVFFLNIFLFSMTQFSDLWWQLQLSIYLMCHTIGGSDLWIVKDEWVKELTNLVTKSSWRLGLLVHHASRVVSKWHTYFLEGIYPLFGNVFLMLYIRILSPYACWQTVSSFFWWLIYFALFIKKICYC